jgi:hypothetical protein
MKILLLATLALSLTACGFGGGCDSGPGGGAEISLYVTDAATGAAVPNPEFATFDGKQLGGTCQGPIASPGACESWVLVGPPAKQQIRITARGYKPALVDVDTTSVASIHLGVEMESL